MNPFSRNFLSILSLLCYFFLSSACSSTKHLKKDEYLLRTAKVHLKTDRKFAEKSILNDELVSLTLQKPNTYLFGFFPYKIWLYNLRYQKYQKDSTNFQITSKVVEKPVIFDSSLVLETEARMKSFLTNEGYFYAEIDHDILKRGKKIKLNYNIQTGLSYLIDSIQYDIEEGSLDLSAQFLNENSLFSKGTSYSNTLAGEERIRLTNLIRNQGYYRFSSENIMFELDTLGKATDRLSDNNLDELLNVGSINSRKKLPALNVKVIIHSMSDSLAFEKYHFHKVVVFPDYQDTSDIRNPNLLIQQLNGTEFRYHKKFVNSSILDKKIFIQAGKYYSEKDYNNTLRELNDLGIFQYVRIFIFPSGQDSLKNALNCFILMNPAKKFDFNTNLEVSGGDLYTIGSAMNVSVTDKNFFKGANQLTTTVAYGVELSQNKFKNSTYFKQFYLSSQNIGLNFRLSFPKFLLPINQDKFNQNNLPRTILDAGVTSLNRINYFSLRSYNSSFGYNWRETSTKTWSVKPAFVNILHLSNIDSLFQLRMDSIPAIKNSYQETFIEGENVEFLINTQGIKKWQYAFLRLGFEEAGGLMSGISSLSSLFNQSLAFQHAQYIRFDFDARQYFLRRRSSVIFRFYGGVGVPYGKSSVMPYIKQYYTGGAYSLRGWRPRVLGPGSYFDPNKQENSSDFLFLDQSGDIKLELNGEYRFNLIKLFSGAISINGAVFTDAGNIWLTNKDPQLLGANFEFRNLFQDLAVSSGAGLRADLGGFLVLRFDWAIPLKQPYILKNYGWVIQDIDLGNRDWRKRNLNLNVAIGYPF